jgi:hypothetical protein
MSCAIQNAEATTPRPETVQGMYVAIKFVPL